MENKPKNHGAYCSHAIRKLPLLLGLLVIMTIANLTAVLAQDNSTVSGVVTDEEGVPLPGVSILIKGAEKGTITDFEGYYSLTEIPDDAFLIYSFIGMKSQEIAVNGQTVIDIKMEQDAIGLGDVVVVGYGTQKKGTLTGSVDQVKAEAIESRAVTNPVLALQGETPGLVITRTSSRPGNENIDMQIRGATSVNGVKPLIVIDGVPIIDATQSSNPNPDFKGNGNALFNMNPDDIESVSILKDGMAAIYGSRAAGGVILVTTKRGKGGMKVDYGFNIRINTSGIKTPTANMQQYATMWLEANAQETSPLWWFAAKDEMLKMQQGIEGIYPTTHWGDIFIGQGDRYPELFQTRFSQQHTISVSGSTNRTIYRLSAGYANNQGNLATAYDGQKQYNLKLNYDYKITDKIKLQTGITYQKDVTSSPSGGLDWSMTSQDPPFFPAKNPYGQWHSNFGNAGNRNATALTTDGGRDIKGNDLVRVDLGTNIQIIEDLSFEGSVSIQSNQYQRDIYKLNVPLYTWDGELAAGSLNSTPNISTESDKTSYQYYNALLRYTKSIGKHQLSLMAGLNAEKNQWKGLYGYRTGISNDGVYDLNAVPYDSGTATNKGGQNQWGLYSYLAKLNYSYNDKYLFDVLIRSDASSKFASGSQTSNFYNIGAGWVVTEENFIKNLNIEAINFLKFKAGYGETGLQSGIGLYDYYSTISLGSAVLGSTPATQPSAWVNGNGLNMSSTTTWERVSMTNIGVEARFLKNRLSAEFNYYNKENNGMLIRVTYPSVLGGTAPFSNSGVLEVKGWEATLNWKDQIGEVTYNVGFNITDNRSNLVSLEGATTWNAGKNSTIVGRPLDSWMMYETNGYFTDQADVNAYYAEYTTTNQGELPLGTDPTTALRPGDVKKVDLDGNGYISALGDPLVDQGDLKYMGDAAPHYVFGLNMGASWKGIDFSAFFQGVGQQYIQRGDYLAYPFVAIWTNQNASFIGKTWTPENSGADYPRMSVYNARNKWNYLNSDFMLQNNQYIRLKSLIIGYTLPKEWLRRVKIERLRVYFSGNDLFEFTTIKDGYDPEQGISSNNAGYPFMRTWALGLNLSF